MRRFGLLILAGVLVVAVGLLAPVRASSTDLLSALGASLGGLRVAVVDVLFLRAERLRHDDRLEEVPALYQAVRRLDPANTAAVDHLAAIYAYDVMAEAPDDQARLGWWLESWALVEAALEDHPKEPALWLRSSDLLLDVAPRHPGLEDAIAERFGDPRRLGIARLLEAVRLTPNVPRRGRIHLLRLVFLLPIVAAGELEAGRPDWRALLADGEAALALRRDDLAAMRLPGEGEPGSGPSLDRFFAARLAVLGEVGTALEAKNRTRARAAADRYEALDPGSRLAASLQRAVEAP